MNLRQLSLPFAAAPLVGALVTAAFLAPDAERDPEPTWHGPTVDAEFEDVLIDLSDRLDASERERFLATLPGEPALNSVFSEQEGLYRVRLAGHDAQRLVERLATHPDVEFVELDETFETFAAPDDPLYPFQWHLEQIDVESGWASADGRGVVVAVIDTGVAFSDGTGRFRRVRDLGGDAFVPGYDFVDDDDEPFDEHGHGTHVAGTIAQTTNNGYGVAGVAPRARIMPIRVLDASGRGNTADIAESIRWAADNGADVINMSLGGPMPSRIMLDAVRYAHRKGVTVVAAAGNSGWSRPSFPAAYDNVIAVSATQYDRTTTFYSNYGKYIDVAAPGGNTRVDQNDDGRPDGVMQETLVNGDPGAHDFLLYMGTSMASPHVAGVAALVHQLGVSDPGRIEGLLQATASREVPSFEPDRYGAGLLDAGAATAGAIKRFQVPRAASAAGVLVLVLGFAGRGRRRSSASAPAAAAAALTVASGLALVAALGFGPVGPALARMGLAQAPVFWLDSAGLDLLAHSALVLSVLPALALYAVFGGARSPLGRGVLVGAIAGGAALLLTEAVVPLADVRLVPGAGIADRLWLLANGLAGVGLAWAAAREA